MPTGIPLAVSTCDNDETGFGSFEFAQNLLEVYRERSEESLLIHYHCPEDTHIQQSAMQMLGWLTELTVQVSANKREGLPKMLVEMQQACPQSAWIMHNTHKYGA